MRKALLAVAATTLLSLPACTEHELVGQWKSGLDPNALEYIEFKSDGEVVLKSAQKTLTGKWSTIEGQRVKIEVVGRLSSLSEMCKYTRAENKLDLDGCTLRGSLQRG